MITPALTGALTTPVLQQLIRARLLAGSRILLLSAIISFAFTPAAWSQTFLEPAGGHGGSKFVHPCTPGEYLTGFELRVGDDVDAIRPICFAPFGQGQRIAPAMYAGEWHGGPGGRLQHLRCPQSEGIGAVVGMTIAAEGRTRVVNEIRLFCGPVSSQPFQLGTAAAVHRGPGYNGYVPRDSLSYNQETQRCPDGEVAVGIHGRTGVWVDALGLICAAPRRDHDVAEASRRPPPIPLGRVHSTKPPPVSLGRKQPTTQGPSPVERKRVPMSVILAPPPICVAAQNARGRNSPAAPGLERQCQIAMEQAAAAARAAPPPPPVVASPVPMPLPPAGNPTPPIGHPPVPSGPWPPSSVCDAAREARYNNDPDAYALESQCRAQGGSVPGPVSNAPGSPGSWQSSPICEAARRARYNNDPDADRLEALCRAGNDVWGQPGRRIPLDYGERSEILDTHNRLRLDFQRLQWDVGLEDSAARSASQMATYGQMMPAQGRNLYMAVPSGRYTFGDVTRIWASERSAFRPGIFPDVTGYGSSAKVTNYTQMIWPDTTHVGCAVERTQWTDFFVCRYAPAGNIYGKLVR